MKQIYFIDSENVNDLWVSLLNTTPEDAELLVFYTRNSPYMSYANLRHLKESTREVTFIRCYEGTNALDFQLVTELGYRLREIQESGEEYEMILVSNDNGFTAAVKYWNDRGMNVRRINGQACSSLTPETVNTTETNPVEESAVTEDASILEIFFEEREPEPATTTDFAAELSTTEDSAKEISAKEISAKEISAKEESAQEDFPKEEVDAIIRCLGKKNLAELYNALLAIYGEKGKDYYLVVKPKSYKVEPQAWKLKEKINKYAAVVFSNAKVNMPQDFAAFLQKSRDKMKNLNSFRAACTKQYGKEKGATYYGIIKPHVKVIASMN